MPADRSGFIYVIENQINGKLYVGQTRNPEKREKYHFSRFTHSSALKAGMNKYGKDNFLFFLIELSSSQEELNSRESYWISELNTISPEGYNLTSGGESPEFSDETKARISQARRGAGNPMYGKSGIDSPTYGRKHSEEAKKKISAIHEGKIIPEELKQRWRRDRAGKNKGEENPFFGKSHNEEARKKMREAGKGRKFSQQHKDNMRKAALERWRRKVDGNV